MGEEANRILCTHFGLPAFPVVAVPPGPFRAEQKVGPVDAYVGARPTAWVDDIVTDDAREWAANRRVPTLLIEVDHALGLTRSHVDALLEWAVMLGSCAAAGCEASVMPVDF